MFSYDSDTYFVNPVLYNELTNIHVIYMLLFHKDISVITKFVDIWKLKICSNASQKNRHWSRNKDKTIRNALTTTNISITYTNICNGQESNTKLRKNQSVAVDISPTRPYMSTSSSLIFNKIS